MSTMIQPSRTTESQGHSTEQAIATSVSSWHIARDRQLAEKSTSWGWADSRQFAAVVPFVSIVEGEGSPSGYPDRRQRAVMDQATAVNWRRSRHP
jgi:hypothetical protein